MQPDHASMTCDCSPEILRIVAAIHESTCPPTPNDSNHTISLSDVLGTGRLLVRNWERLNGCFNASSHLDAALLRAIADAANGLIGLYEYVGTAAGMLPAIGRGTDRERRTSRMATSSPCTTSTPSQSISGSSNPLGRLVPIRSPTYLGTHSLDEDEAIMVGREALRHSILLLGEVLHDISKDLEELGDNDIDGTRPKLEKTSADLLRLLGRINT
ncbi:hypothetical protein N8I77_002806 [Diaporthe amygdali]|uniref:Uncharacterized protein n=1 Tax=Phomopsis amygdali TaxID=1214568 RepID=A0AAD9W9J5_PHOAM|nr:hypothetical protein N8I77_002806 [Diaporthe amygdali]